MIDPRGLTISEWADYVVPEVEAFGNVGRLDDPSDWRAWANRIASLSEMQERNVPSPFEFTDWQNWAFAFSQQFDRGL